jgi:hypothetical protein
VAENVTHGCDDIPMGDLPQYWPSHEDRRFTATTLGIESPLIDRARQFVRHAGPRAVSVLRTAAMLHGVETLPPGYVTTGWPVEFTHHRGEPLPEPELSAAGSALARTYRWEIPDDQVSIVQGIPTTTRDRTLVDCAREMPRLEALAAVDQLLRVGARADQAEWIVERQLWPLDQVRRIAGILAMADPRSESPMESWCRCMIIDADLPPVRPQVEVLLPDGGRAYLDLGFEEYRLGVEYDGARHHTAVHDVEHDRHRRSLIARAGWGVSVFRSDRVIADPAAMLWQLAGQLRSRGWSPSPERRERTRKRINFIAMQRRLERERKFGVRDRSAEVLWCGAGSWSGS